MYDRLGIRGGRVRASDISGRNADTITKWGKGEGLTQFLALAAIAAETNVSLDWLAFGHRPPIPVKGLAECGIAGWYQEAPLSLLATAPETLDMDQETVAVVAVGDSMRPAGISPGDVVFCQPGAPQDGSSVLVELMDGKVSIKRWAGRQGDWVMLQGWLAPEDGVQMPYDDKRREDQLRRVLVVSAVTPGIAPIIEHSQDDERLYEVAIRATLRWYDSAELELIPDGAPDVIATAVHALRVYLATGPRTDAELEAEVVRALNLSKSMLKALGWKPKRS